MFPLHMDVNCSNTHFYSENIEKKKNQKIKRKVLFCYIVVALIMIEESSMALDLLEEIFTELDLLEEMATI